MNRLSEYITGMTLTRQHLNEAKISMANRDANNHTRALNHLIHAFDAFVSATSCAVSIREKKKPKKGVRS